MKSSMKTKLATLFFLSLLIMSCAKKAKDETTEEIVADSTEMLMYEEHNAKNSLDYIGMYKGVVPCADCEGIETTLWLDDNNFVLITNYLGKKSKA